MTERYEAALATLTADDRELLVARIEMGYDNAELARLFGKPSKDAARVAVGRALVRLAAAMNNG
jgi:DNA-directed RNA polymerase specialized sigma24 family protein